MNNIQNLANALGFRGVYLLKPAPYPHFAERRADGSLHKNSAHLSADPVQDYPWANAVLLLLLPYRPYLPARSVSGYYPASNRAYHVVDILISQLKECGVRAERAALPIRETLLRHGIGIACKNGLTAVKPFGTRFIAQTLALAVSESVLQQALDVLTDDTVKTCPPNCDLCIRACPSQAISASGMDFTHCIRADMEGGVMRTETMEKMSSLLGCELCQFCCPLNAKVEMDADLPEAFELSRLLSGDTKPALELIGKNMKSGGRLEQHALIMAARQGRIELLPMIEPYLSDSRPQIQQAAKYAISVLHNPRE